MKIVFTIMLLFFLISGLSFAANITVEKLLQNNDLKTGDMASISLKITNSFGSDIAIKLVDKNIFGDNGLDMQCMEYTIPAGKEAVLNYDPIQPYSSGKFTVAPAEITFTNPDSGKEETVKSNSLSIDVKDSGVKINSQGITTIYRCNGTNMQSTSYSSSSQSQSQNQNNQNQQNQSQQQAMQNQLQNNQMNQNADAVKKQMEEQAKQQEQMKKEFENNIAKNNDFQKANQEMEQKGYGLQNISSAPESNNSGNFEASYKNQNDESASMKGEMQNNTMKNLMTQTEQDRQQMMQQLMNNTDFKKYDQQMNSTGYNQSNVSFNQISQNQTNINVSYSKQLGNQTQNASITAQYVNQTITNVEMKKESENNIFFSLLIIIILSAIAFAYWKYFRKKIENEILPKIEKKEKIDYKKEARKMLEEAKKIFKSKPKDAFQKISQAVRMYFSHELGLAKDITSEELMRKLDNTKGYKKHLNNLKSCLEICHMVEFAKHKPDEDEFSQAIELAEKALE